MATTKTNKTAAKAAKPATETAPNTDQDQTTSTNPATAAEASTPEPAASPTYQPAVDTPTSADKGDSDNQETGDEPGPNMTGQEYEALYGQTPAVKGDNASGEHPGAILTAERLGLSPRQHITAIITGGVISGILARTKPYEMLDLRKAAEAVGMCDSIVEMILHLDDPMPEPPDGKLNS
ncbi:hypothetical protein [Akkermansia sp.]|uniref:hypothetical protein n=1 Tax=Akkermansia sp. TaxID=1872421 RepID=UPI003A875F1C